MLFNVNLKVNQKRILNQNLNHEEKEHPVITIRNTLKSDIYKRIEPLTIRNTEYAGVSTKTTIYTLRYL